MQIRRCWRCWPTPILSPSQPLPYAHTHTVDWNIFEVRLVPLPLAELARGGGEASGSQGFCSCLKARGCPQEAEEDLQLMPRSSPTPVPSCPLPCQASLGH